MAEALADEYIDGQSKLYVGLNVGFIDWINDGAKLDGSLDTGGSVVGILTLVVGLREEGVSIGTILDVVVGDIDN
jgi:hypothetical protein